MSQIFKNSSRKMNFSARRERTVEVLAGTSGIVQGLAWMLMASICIALHNMDRRTYLYPYDSYMTEVQFYIYVLFIQGTGFSRQTLTPNVFQRFACAFLIFNFLWVLASVNVLCRNNSRNASKLWCYVSWVICLLDAIMVVILGADYQTCMNSANYYLIEDVEAENFCATGILPVLVIAAKGFVLWILNFTLTIILFKISIRPKQISKLYQSQPTYVYPLDQMPPTTFVPQRQPTTHNQPPAPFSPNQENFRHSFAYSPKSQNFSHYPPSPTSPVSPNQEKFRHSFANSPKSQNFSHYPPSPTSPVTPTRQWHVHSSSSAAPKPPGGQEWRMQRRILSHQNHMSSPPSQRY